MKFIGVVGCGSRNSRLNFDGIPDQALDLGIFLKDSLTIWHFYRQPRIQQEHAQWRFEVFECFLVFVVMNM